MKITALEEYGLRCMVRLAKAGPGKALSLAEFSDLEGLSIPYAGRLMGLLKDAGLVTAERGRNGGYTLSRTAKEVRLKEIFEALGEPVFGASHCDRYQAPDAPAGNCAHSKDCAVRDVWFSFYRMIADFLEQITLDDLAGRKPGGRFDLFELAGRRQGETRRGRTRQQNGVQA